MTSHHIVSLYITDIYQLELLGLLEMLYLLEVHVLLEMLCLLGTYLFKQFFTPLYRVPVYVHMF